MQNKVTARKRANAFLAEWRAKHTRVGQEPPYDREFEDLTESWPECWGYLVNRPHEKELHDIFADADGFVRCEIRFLTVRDLNHAKTKQPHRCDFVFHRTDGRVVRLHPSHAKDAEAVITDFDLIAITKGVGGVPQPAPTPLHTYPVDVSRWPDGPRAFRPRLLHENFSTADKPSAKKAFEYLANKEHTWKQQWRTGYRGPWKHDLTDKDAEFPWKAWLSGLPTVVESIEVRTFDDIKEFAVVYVLYPEQRTAFYVVHVDGTEWIMEPGKNPIRAALLDVDRNGWH